MKVVFSHYACCDLTDVGVSRKKFENHTQTVSKMETSGAFMLNFCNLNTLLREPKFHEFLLNLRRTKRQPKKKRGPEK